MTLRHLFLTGVEVTNTDIFEVIAGSLVVESDDEVTFDLNLRISSVAAASSISGTGLWSVDVFISDDASCQTATTDRITAALGQVNRDKALVAGAVLLLNNVMATVPLDDALCEDISHVCVAFGQGPSPSPNFTLVPLPDNSSLIGSEAIECRGRTFNLYIPSV